MTRAQLIQAVIDRGFDYESNSKIGGFIDRAYQGICARHPWPFLEAEASTTSGSVEISDLRKVLFVKDTTQEAPLRGVDRRWIQSSFSTLTETGHPSYWYLENKTLKTYPVSENSVTVRYLKIPTTLGDSDSPVVPEEWQYLIVDRAVVDCLKSDDEYLEARALRQEVNEAIATEMVPALLSRNLQNNGFVQRTGYYTDYLG